MTSHRPARLVATCVASLALATGCMSLDYDLSTVQMPISVQAESAPGAVIEPITIEGKHVMYVHGLLGESEPDVASMIDESAHGYSRISDFRITYGANFHDWLMTHLTLTLLRFKSVTIEMERVR